MKLVKTQICLYLYEELLTVGYFNSDEIKNKFNLENKTFHRYINEIRAYLLNFYKSCEIIYNREKQRFYLIKNT